MTTVLIVAATIVLLWAVKHQGDHILDEILGAELREIDRDRAAGRQAGFDAGWHGGGRR